MAHAGIGTAEVLLFWTCLESHSVGVDLYEVTVTGIELLAPLGVMRSYMCRFFSQRKNVCSFSLVYFISFILTPLILF